MPKIKYQDLLILRSAKHLAVVDQANAIIVDYQNQGFTLTLRQLYYQFVSRDLIPNNAKEYKRLGSIINDARLAGLVDWNALEDRTRSLRAQPHWEDPAAILDVCARQFSVDRWEDQPNRVEVWIEKDALVGVIEGVCDEFDVPYFSCRGYTSQSEMWVAGRRLRQYRGSNQVPVVLHFGDHDPSGIDMTRDIRDRLEMFVGGSVDVRRMALNMDQVEQYNPPPNFAKITDSRCAGYIREYGEDSWELDALEPAAIAELIRGEIRGLLEPDRWAATGAAQEEGRRRLALIAENFDEVVNNLDQ
jgi:hypothetical protein